MQCGKLDTLLAVLFLSIQLQLLAQTSDTVRVLSLENAWNEAESHKDVKALAILLAPTFVYTDADGAFEDKAQFLADIPDVTATQIVNEGMKAESYGDAIVVTGAYREQGIEKGKPYTRRGRFTDTWVLQNGQWLCAASQETLIAH
jgi:ketosteroid isomerase-like protein